MEIQNPFYIIILLFLFNTGDGSALLMHENSNGRDPIHGSSGHGVDVAEIKQMVLNLTTVVENLQRQTEILGKEKELLQNRVFFLEAELNKLNASKPPTNDELMAYLKSTKQIVQSLAANEEYDKNLTLRLNEAEDSLAMFINLSKKLTQRLNEVKNVLTANEEYDKNLTQQLTDSVNNLHDLKIQMRYTSLSLMDVHSKTDKLNTTFDDQIRDVYGRITNMTQKVAFTAGVTSYSTSWNSGTLVFDRIVYNIGGGYDSSTGVFTSPVDGHFVFSINVQPNYNPNTYTCLVLNGSGKVKTLTQADMYSVYSAGPNLVVLRLQKGDRVWVEHDYGTGYHTRGDVPMTTFSGFLI